MLEMTIINVIFLTNVEKCFIFGLSQLLSMYLYNFIIELSEVWSGGRFFSRFAVPVYLHQRLLRRSWCTSADSTDEKRARVSRMR